MSHFFFFSSAGSDASLFLPCAILKLAKKYGHGSDGVRKAVIQYLAIIVSGAAVVDALLLPMRPYSSRPAEENPEEASLISHDKGSGKTEVVANPQKTSIRTPLYWTLSLGQQLATLDFWLFVMMLSVAFCRKKHYSLMIRPILAEMDADPSKATANFYADTFNLVVPAGFAPAILWGALVDYFGINACLFASNILGTTFIILSLIPSLPVQILTIGVYILYQCFIMSQALAFTASVYGFTTLATLQGICCSVIGIFSVLMDIFWPSFVNNTLGSYRMAQVIWLVISCILFIFPVLLTLLSRRRNEDEQIAKLRTNHGKDGFQISLPPTQVFDRESITLLERRSSPTLRSSVIV